MGGGGEIGGWGLGFVAGGDRGEGCGGYYRKREEGAGVS